MIVDNFDLISNILEWNNKDEFYFLQIIQRKKDGNETGRGNNGARLIKAYYIFNKEQLERKKDKIIELCEANNARAYIHINRRNAYDSCLLAIQEYVKLVREGNCFQGIRVWDHVCGLDRDHKYPKLWIVDVDIKDQNYINKIIEIIQGCRGAENRIKYQIPTLHGVHLITLGFDVNQFKQELAIARLEDIDVQKDNPTLLYYRERE